MATTQVEFELNETESNNWLNELKLDVEEKEDDDRPMSMCPYCKYFHRELERDGLGFGISYWGWYCDAKDEKGEDIHYAGAIEDFFITECPYFIKSKEQK